MATVRMRLAECEALRARAPRRFTAAEARAIIETRPGEEGQVDYSTGPMLEDSLLRNCSIHRAKGHSGPLSHLSTRLARPRLLSRLLSLP
jgi:hypothetical protein